MQRRRTGVNGSQRNQGCGKTQIEMSGSYLTDTGRSKTKRLLEWRP